MEKPHCAFFRRQLEILDKALSPQNVVYHYTDEASYQNILTSGELWLNHHTNVNNDPNEYEFGYDLLQKYLSDLPTLTKIDKEAFITTLKKTFEEETNIYIACFSCNDNDYCKRTYGEKTLSFNLRKGLNKLILNSVGLFLKVEYFDYDFKKNGESHVKRYLKEIIDYYHKNERSIELGEFACYLYFVVPLIKKCCHRCDKEIRLCFIENKSLPLWTIDDEKHKTTDKEGKRRVWIPTKDILMKSSIGSDAHYEQNPVIIS